MLSSVRIDHLLKKYLQFNEEDWDELDTFSTRIFRWLEFWTTFQDLPFILKFSGWLSCYRLHSDEIFV